jgi:peptide/nickel transport system substrate-binding protein
MGALFVAGVIWWRGCQPESGSPLQSDRIVSESTPHERGGQVVASLRAEPRSFNRLVTGDQTTETIWMLMQGRLLRINRSTFELEPWLAAKWESTADGRTHTLHLRPDVVWSDGTRFTSADVLFSLRALYDPTVKSVIASSLMVGGKPIAATAPDAATVVLTYAAPSGPGLRLLDMLPILPRHRLESALSSGTLAKAWGTATPPAEIVGTGPFTLAEYQPGQRVIFDRNPRYWRKAPDGSSLPYIDRLVLELVPDQNAELLRLQAGSTDLTHSELRSDDYIPIRRAEDEGKVRMVELGVAPDADAFWFCLKPEKKGARPAFCLRQQARVPPGDLSCCRSRSVCANGVPG